MMTELTLDQLGNDEICKICLKEVARYTCPKCNLRYCSLPCYRDQKHLQCSEKFYKDCCVEQMKQQTGSKEDKEKMMEILKRMQEEQNLSDDGTTENLEERLHGLDLDADSELVWQQLTDREKEEFQKMLGDGRIGHLLDTYTPWWKHQHSRVVEISSTDDPSTPISQYPVIPSNLPPLNTLLKAQPSPLLKYNVVNVLYSYAYIVRLFNGSHIELIQQAVEGLLSLSGVLSHNAVFHDCNSAIKDAINNSQQHKGTATSLEFAYAVLLDVSCIVTSGSHDCCLVLHALSDLHHMIQRSCTKVKGSKKSSTKGVISTKMLREVERKVFFLLVWSKEHYSDLLLLQKVIELEHEGLVKELKEHRDMESKFQESQACSKVSQPSQNTPQQSVRLIEEL